MSKKKETLLNFGIGLLSQIVILIFGLLVPRVILSSYGSDTNGLLGTITQVFTYVALLEAGVSIATRNALYAPLHQKNKEDISTVLSFSRKYYRKIALIYLAFIIILSFLLPIVLKTTTNYWIVFLVIIFEGLTSFLSFYFVDAFICFLNTSGKVYINNIFDLIYKVLGYIIKIVIALLGFNIAFIQIGFFVFAIIRVLMYSVYLKKKFKWINFKQPTKDYKLPDRKAYTIAEIAWTIFSSTDIIVLSIFLSTSLSSVYSIYNLIFMSICLVLNSIYNASSYHLGETYQDDIEKYKKVHNIYTSFILAITTVLLCVSYWLTIPFVKLYTSGINDVNYIYEFLPLLFCLVQLLSWSRYVSGNLTNIAGYAKLTSKISIIEASANIILSISLVFSFGIYGVLIATVVCLPLKIIFTNYMSERKILKRNPIKMILIIGCNYTLFALTVILNLFIKIKIDSFQMFILYGIIFTTIYIIVVGLINILVNKDILKINYLFKKKDISNLTATEEEN